MAKIILENEAAPPATEGTGKTVLYTESDGIHVVLESGSTVGPIGPKTGPAGGSLAGSYPNPSIALGAVGATQLALAAVGATQLALAAVGTTQIALGAITAPLLNVGVAGLLPTAQEKAALAGTSGAPSGTNKYVTDSDTRLTYTPLDANFWFPPGSPPATVATALDTLAAVLVQPPANPQPGVYILSAQDSGSVVFATNAGPQAFSLPAMNTGVLTGQTLVLTIQCTDVLTAVTITPAVGSQIDGSGAPFVMTVGRGRVSLFSPDGLLWYSGTP